MKIHQGSLSPAYQQAVGRETTFRMQRRYIPENRFIRPCFNKEIAVVAVEVGEIRVYLEDPIGLNEGDAANIDEIASPS